MKIESQSQLKWPAGWPRCRIVDRKTRPAWKKSFSAYRDDVVKQLGRMGVQDVLFTFNIAPADRMDCGVAVYFSKIKSEDYTWQEALELTTPAPTLDEIDSAYKRKAMIHHPDRPGGDNETYLFYRKHYENAKAYVLGTEKHEHEYVLPVDRFNETRLNMAAIRMALAALRQLEAVGAPALLERTFRGFKTALPAHASTEVKA